MRRLLQLVCLFAAASAFAASPHDRIPLIKLEDGRELRNFEIVSFGTSTVMAKWEGGRGTINYSSLPSNLRLIAEKHKPGASPTTSTTASKPPINKPSTLKNDPRDIIGQVFITTRGAGAYKFAGASVRAYTANDFEMAKAIYNDIIYHRARLETIGTIEAWEEALKNYPPISATLTDADGLYKLKATGHVVVVCVAQRTVTQRTESNLWIVPVQHQETRIDLNNSNSETIISPPQQPLPGDFIPIRRR